MIGSQKRYWSDYEWSATAPFTGLTGGQPCDTGQVWTIADNVQHLVDEAPCYRINWVSPLFGDVLNKLGAYPYFAYAYPQSASLATARLSLSHEFPTTIVREGEYPNYTARLGLWLRAGTANCTMILSARGASPGAGTENPEVFGVLRGTTGATAGRWMNLTPDLPQPDGYYVSSGFSPVLHGRNPGFSGQWYAATPPAGLVRSSQGLPAPRTKLQAFSIFVRLQVIVETTSGGSGDLGDVAIIGMQVREIPVGP
ncbi:MAG TPA: hypothetical protein VJ724_15270 [Tahibacter sp.]|nr:hypothetical protein [Tahibacter sp.]